MSDHISRRDDCTSGSILQKVAGIRRSLCLGLLINKEKKFFLLFSALIFVKMLTKGSEGIDQELKAVLRRV